MNLYGFVDNDPMNLTDYHGFKGYGPNKPKPKSLPTANGTLKLRNMQNSIKDTPSNTPAVAKPYNAGGQSTRDGTKTGGAILALDFIAKQFGEDREVNNALADCLTKNKGKCGSCVAVVYHKFHSIVGKYEYAGIKSVMFQKKSCRAGAALETYNHLHSGKDTLSAGPRGGYPEEGKPGNIGSTSGVVEIYLCEDL